MTAMQSSPVIIRLILRLYAYDLRCERSDVTCLMLTRLMCAWTPCPMDVRLTGVRDKLILDITHRDMNLASDAWRIAAREEGLRVGGNELKR